MTYFLVDSNSHMKELVKHESLEIRLVSIFHIGPLSRFKINDWNHRYARLQVLLLLEFL